MASNADILAVATPQVKSDEGCKLTAYPDPLSGAEPYTVGWGCTGPSIGPGTVWTQDQADQELAARLDDLCGSLDGHIAWWRSLDAVRAAVLVNMAYNMGVAGLMGFPHMLSCCEAGDYDGAADQMIASKWATQLHYNPADPLASRPGRLEVQMRTGIAQ